MGIRQRIKEIFGKKGITLTDAQSIKALFPQLFTGTYNYTSFAYACINSRATNLAMAKILLQKYFKGEWIEVENDRDYAYNFFQSTNRYGQTISDLVKMTSISLDLKGQAFWWIIKDGLGTPTEFILLPSTTNIILTEDETDIDSYEYVTKGKTIYLPKEDVIFFNLPKLDNPFLSTATVDAIPDQLAIDSLQTQFQRGFLTNNARFDGFLSTEKSLTKEQIEDLAKQWTVKHGGASNAGKTPVLQGGLDYKLMQSSVKEMDFVQSRAAIRDEIMTIFGVPKSVLGVLEDSNKANTYASMQGYLRKTIIPWGKTIESKLTSFVKSYFRDNLKIVFDFQLEEDPETVVKQMDLLIKNNAITINELREAYGYGAEPQFDKQPNGQ